MNRYLSRILAIVLTVVTVPVAAAGSASARPPVRYHLALGDSLPYGFTTAKARAGLPPSAFTGFTDVIARTVRGTTVNYSCPGETTASFLSGPCIWRASGFSLHDDYTGSQVAAAEAFLASQPRGHRGLITVTLWGNDIRLFLESCPDIQCVQQRAPAEIAALAERLRQTLSRLRSAAPHAHIVLLGAFTVELINVGLADHLIGMLNTAMAQAAGSAGAGFANPAPVFNPPGDARRAVICQLTLICTENDSHPSTAGHDVLAALILSTRDPR